MHRILSSTFIADLMEGQLKELLSYIKSDNSLDLEIRGNYINIYYRGGSVLKITEERANKYVFHFDKEYLKVTSFILEDSINTHISNFNWNNYFPLAKQAMDFYFTKYNKEEREFQQLVVRENNYSTFANSTDYFIIDIEYDNRKNARFDIVAIEWESNTSARKLSKGYMPKLVVIEMKYGDSALNGKAGIQKHISDFEKFANLTTDCNEFKKEMLGVFSQKRQLGLIPCLSELKNSNAITQFSDEVELMFLIANHDPASSILKSELQNLGTSKIITSNFLGYGLFKENVFDSDQFLMRFKTQIQNNHS